MNTMTHRIAFALLVLPFLLVQPLSSAKAHEYVWRMATVFPTKMPILTTGPKRFAAYVERASGGRMKIEIHGRPVHKKKPAETLGLVTSGTYQMVHTTALFYKKKEPAFDVISGIPFGFTPMEHYAWLYGGGGQELMQELFARHGVVAFSVGNTGTQMGGWFKSEIKTSEDFKGLRMRIAGFGGEMLEGFGATAVRLPGKKIPEAFNNNKIDAAEFVGPAIDEKLQLYDHAQYYYAPWNQPSVDLQVLINKAAFDALPADLQAIIEVAARAATLDAMADAIVQNAEAWQKMKAKPTVAVRAFSDETAKRMQEKGVELLKQLGENNADAKRAVGSFNAFFEKIKDYSNLTDSPYLQMRSAQ